MSLCRKCKYCKWIDIEGNIFCKNFIMGREKTFCIRFEPKTVKE